MNTAGLRGWAMAGVLLLMWAVLALLPATRDAFLTEYNFNNLTLQVSHVAIVAVGMTLVIILRGIDLSVGSAAALCGVVAALLQIDHGMPAWVAIGAALACGAALGAAQGWVIARFGIPAFVVTLAGYNAYRGAALVLSDARGLAPMSDDFLILIARIPPLTTLALILSGCALGAAALVRDAARRRRLGLTAPGRLTLGARLAACAAVAAFLPGDAITMLLETLPLYLLFELGVLLAGRTRFGRHVYAVGGNPEAARAAGIDVVRTQVLAYLFLGLLTAVAALILAARVNAVTPGNTGNQLELDVITAVVIGGTSLGGGRGSILGALLGALVFGTVANGMNLLGVDSNWQLILKGCILLTAVAVDVALKGKRA
ncbi:MAG TPA: hypothetical protein VL172_21165 [Kofleriaceae bacterium]|nr:hypothetical protein [Kofleriaceae bacterium]